MEVDVRLIILVMLYVMITAKDDDSKDLTDKLTYHCGLCLRNISRAACMILGDGVLSCVKCKEYNLHEDGMQCGHCPTKVDGTVIGLPTRGSCETCVCNGTVDANQLKGCDDLDRSRCFVCRPNSTGILCKHCADDSKLHLCSTKQTDDNVEPQRRSGFSKEKIIVAVCSVFGAACLSVIVFLLYRHFKSRGYSMKKPFRTVELTNRNYDDLDFSLLNPIADVPFVYRTDVGEFDNEALLSSEKPQLVIEAGEGDSLA